MSGHALCNSCVGFVWEGNLGAGRGPQAFVSNVGHPQGLSLPSPQSLFFLLLLRSVLSHLIKKKILPSNAEKPSATGRCGDTGFLSHGLHAQT